jgi:hypothetical protein
VQRLLVAPPFTEHLSTLPTLSPTPDNGPQILVSTEAEVFWYKVSLGTALESKSSDLDVFEPGCFATATFPNLKIWTPARSQI